MNLQIKVILSLRDEFLGYLDELSAGIPKILNNRFRVLPLTVEQGKEAILEPANIESDELATPPFTYSEEILSSIILFLSGKKDYVDEFNYSYIEPFHLQTICSHIEKNLQINSKNENLVSDEVYKNDKNLQEILTTDFIRKVNSLKFRHKKKAVLHLLESGLINTTGHRVILDELTIVQYYNVDTESLNKLESVRILKCEKKSTNKYYEIYHDSIALSIIQNKEQRIEDRRSSLLAGSLFLFLIFFLVFLILSITGVSRFYSNTIFGAILTVVLFLLYCHIRYDGFWSFVGRKLFSMNRFSLVVYILNKHLSAHLSTSVNYNKILGISYYYLGNYYLALDKLKRADELKSKDEETSFYLAEVFSKLGHYEKSYELFNELLEKDPGNVNILLKVGDILDLQEKYTEALNIFSNIVNINPRFAPVYYFEGITLVKMGKFDEAISSFEKAIHYDNAYASALYALGKIYYFQKNNNEKALALLMQAKKAGMTYADLYYVIGRIYYEKKEYEMALKSFDLAILADKSEQYYYSKLASTVKSKKTKFTGNAFKEMKRAELFDDSFFRNRKAEEISNEFIINIMTQAIELDETDASAYALKASCLLQKGQIEKSIELLNYYDDNFEKNNPTILGQLAWIYFDNYKDYEKSVTLSKAALEVDEKAFWIRGNLAIALLFSGDFECAKVEYKKAIEVLLSGEYTDDEKDKRTLLKDQPLKDLLELKPMLDGELLAQVNEMIGLLEGTLKKLRHFQLFH